VLDVAQRVASVGSLGVPRVVLAQHRCPRKLPILLDLKLAPPAAAAGQHGVRSLIGLRKRTA